MTKDKMTIEKTTIDKMTAQNDMLPKKRCCIKSQLDFFYYLTLESNPQT